MFPQDLLMIGLYFKQEEPRRSCTVDYDRSREAFRYSALGLRTHPKTFKLKEGYHYCPIGHGLGEFKMAHGVPLVKDQEIKLTFDPPLTSPPPTLYIYSFSKLRLANRPTSLQRPYHLDRPSYGLPGGML